MEALAILFVFVVAAVIFVVTWFGVANSPRNTLAELDLLEEYRDTLHKKALRAQLERWDDTMMDRLADELQDVELRIEKLAPRKQPVLADRGRKAG
jgi:predicted house-cleaning noncanonical NTP pyrophosphatase (MazG superfamily)